MPLLCLVDHDPHGVEILTTYKFGSSAMAFNNEHLAISRLNWLGVHHHDYELSNSSVLPFSSTDDKKMLQLMTRPWLSAQNDGARWRHEIERLHLNKRKAEIEILSDYPGGLVQYVRRKIEDHDWI